MYPLFNMDFAESLVYNVKGTFNVFNIVKEKGIQTAYLLFEGEQHGFRKSETIEATLSGELYFYLKIFHISSNDPLQPIKIENWEN